VPAAGAGPFHLHPSRSASDHQFMAASPTYLSTVTEAHEMRTTKGGKDPIVFVWNLYGKEE